MRVSVRAHDDFIVARDTSSDQRVGSGNRALAFHGERVISPVEDTDTSSVEGWENNPTVPHADGTIELFIHRQLRVVKLERVLDRTPDKLRIEHADVIGVHRCENHAAVIGRPRAGEEVC